MLFTQLCQQAWGLLHVDDARRRDKGYLEGRGKDWGKNSHVLIFSTRGQLYWVQISLLCKNVSWFPEWVALSCPQLQWYWYSSPEWHCGFGLSEKWKVVSVQLGCKNMHICVICIFFITLSILNIHLIIINFTTIIMISALSLTSPSPFFSWRPP